MIMAKAQKTVAIDNTAIPSGDGESVIPAWAAPKVEPKTEDKAPKAVACDIVGRQLTFTFGTGSTASINLDDLIPSLVEQAALHGLKQKIVDAAAISRDPVTGKSATFADKEAACRDIIDRLLAGHWNKPAGEPRDDTGGMFLRALMEVWGSDDVAATKARMAAWDKDQIAAVKKNPRVTAIMARMATEAAKAKGIDSDALLGDI